MVYLQAVTDSHEIVQLAIDIDNTEFRNEIRSACHCIHWITKIVTSSYDKKCRKREHWNKKYYNEKYCDQMS